MARKRTRHALRWRIDQDYRGKLSEAERLFLDRFNGEYYRGEFEKDAEPLHPPELRKDSYRRDHAARRDLATAGQRAVLEELTPVASLRGQRRRYYAPEDYTSRDVADAMDEAFAEAIDARRRV